MQPLHLNLETFHSRLSKHPRSVVELDDKSINNTYGGMTFNNGKAEFTLKHGKTKTATGLPTGITYTVEEETEDGFITTSSGVTGKIATGKKTAAFTNTKDIYFKPNLFSNILL